MTGWHKSIVRGVYKLPSVRAPMFKTTLNNRLMNLTCLDWFWVKSLGIPIILLRTKYILQKLLRPVHKAENFFSHSTNQAIKEIKVYGKFFTESKTGWTIHFAHNNPPHDDLFNIMGCLIRTPTIRNNTCTWRCYLCTLLWRPKNIYCTEPTYIK